MRDAILGWLPAFGFTHAVEVPIVLFALSRARLWSDRPPASRWLRRTLAALACSCITHPFVWFVFPALFQALPGCEDRGYLALHCWWWMLLVAESWVVLVEGGLLSWYGLKHALPWAFAANLASVVLGFASRALFDWPP